MIACMALAMFTLDGQAQKKKTTLSAEIYGYQREMIYFDCAQTPMIRQEFHTNPGEEHCYSFETDELVFMLINSWTEILLQPGDSLHTVIRYEGKTVQSMEFSGTPRAVSQNRLLWNIEQLKRNMRYKSQLLACAVVDVKPKDRIADSRTLLQKVQEMIKQAGDGISPEAAEYILAWVETDVYNSFMEYPYMYAEIRKVPIDKQEIGDYWHLMDGYKLRSDKASLRCPAYAELLMRYCFYTNDKKAHEAGKTYTVPTRFEDMYKELAAFYTGDQRDLVLYTLIVNFIRGGKEIERAEALLKEYKAKYNKNKEYLEILDSMLQ